jgi:predicted AlkP superfamily phosphohydrolase/phosphomutase
MVTNIKKSSRRIRLLLIGGLVIAVLPAFAQEAASSRRVIILGFDGVEPKLVDSMLSQGELPNLAKLKAEGAYERLGSTNPPQSPSAWSSFATSTPPQDHGIYDFLARDPATYKVVAGFGSFDSLVFDADGSVKKPMTYSSIRVGEAFWVHADREGRRCKVLNVPFAFPPDDLKNGSMMCGLGVPDVRGTQSYSYWMSDAFTNEQLGEDVFGGLRIPLVFKDNVAITRISTAPKPSSEPGRTQYLTLPLAIRVDRTLKTATIELILRNVTVAEGRWSDWVEWTLAPSPKTKFRALSRFYAVEIGERVRLYMTCMQFHPSDPMMPISSPTSYSSELYDRYGAFKTIGWDLDTHALRRDGLDEDGFLADVEATMAWREKLMIEELDRGNFELLISVWTDTDRVAHMFWRFRDPKHPLYTPEGAKKYGDALEKTYRRMDTIVGKAMERLRPDDLLFVISDHGFHSFRVGFNVNTWLVRQGYLAIRGQNDPVTAFSDEKWLAPYDWNKTKAFGLTLGGIFLNKKDRELHGIVTHDESVALLNELKDKLMQVTYPPTGEKVFAQIYTRDELPATDALYSPDIQLAFADGFQTTKASVAGAAPKELFEQNTDKWSGEHAASAQDDTPGILFSNRKIDKDGPTILDIGPTSLNWLGCSPFVQAKGIVLISERP